ncbi:RIMS-binding protein 2 [Exaiptasia diaphana]|nr:RIMS-binding protein 2 [Exaiptasia diaphana]
MLFNRNTSKPKLVAELTRQRDNFETQIPTLKEVKSPRAKSSSRMSSFPKGCVALFDYNPQAASVSGQPDKELTLKEGDQLTLLGDMDINGCYEAELNGVKGLVPGLYIEEVEEGLSSNQVDKQRKPLANDNSEAANGRQSMSPCSTASDLDIRKQRFIALFDYDPYQSCTTGQPELDLPFKKGDILIVYDDMDAHGYYRAEMNGMQ